MTIAMEATITNYTTDEGVKNPIMSEITEFAIANLEDIINNFELKFSHEIPFGRGTCDINCHI